MTRIVEMFGGAPLVSIELWPPRTPAAEARLEHSFDRLAALAPAFASITYGAAGSTRDRTHDLVVSMQRDHATTAMAHLTCAAHRRGELVEILERYRDAGIENILALRGDPPSEVPGPVPEGELSLAVELVELVRSVGPFCIAVAAHPAGHPAMTNLAEDRRHLAAKLDRADLAITQFFFGADEYLGLVDDLAGLGLDKPVIPGIMPITSLKTIARMEALSGTIVPDEIVRRFADVNPEDVFGVGVEIAVELGARLLAEGAPGLHFYTMNQFAATFEVCTALGLVPERSET